MYGEVGKNGPADPTPTPTHRQGGGYHWGEGGGRPGPYMTWLCVNKQRVAAAAMISDRPWLLGVFVSGPFWFE